MEHVNVPKRLIAELPVLENLIKGLEIAPDYAAEFDVRKRGAFYIIEPHRRITFYNIRDMHDGIKVVPEGIYIDRRYSVPIDRESSECRFAHFYVRYKPRK